MLQESYNCLLQEQQWLEEYSKSASAADAVVSSSILPPPSLLAATETRIELTPPSASISPSLLEKVAYYKLYGKAASGSNIKVRETDNLFPGLGVEVITNIQFRESPYYKIVHCIGACRAQLSSGGGRFGAKSRLCFCCVSIHQ